jgi:hypothetical protein
MKKTLMITAVLTATSTLTLEAQSLLITEVYSTGNSNGTYAADWFELTNFSASPIDITGWKVDDNSQSPTAAVALVGVTSIGAGQSVVFLEGNSAGTNLATINNAFKTAWFGTTSWPIILGNYYGSGIGLSSSSDQVNLFNPSGATPSTPVASVQFGTATNGKTFQNPGFLNVVSTPLTTLSAAGVDGSFPSSNGFETGSPGLVPEPSTIVCLIGGLGMIGMFRRRF